MTHTLGGASVARTLAVVDLVGDAYAAVADEYTELFGHVSSVHPDDVALIEHHLTITSGTVLDLGCGPGHLTAHLMASGVRTIGLDLAPAFIEHAHTACVANTFVVGSLRHLPFRDAAASGILAWYSLIHLPPTEIDGMLTELRRVAALGSRVVVGFFDGDDVAEFPHRVTAGYLWPVDELAGRMTRSGFLEVDRVRRPAAPETGTRPHGALVAVAV